MAKKYLKEDLRAEWEQWRDELDWTVSDQEQLDKIEYFLKAEEAAGDDEGARQVVTEVLRFYLDSGIIDALEGWGDNATIEELADLINFQLDLSQLLYDHGYDRAARIIKADLDNFGRNFIEWCTERR